MGGHSEDSVLDEVGRARHRHLRHVGGGAGQGAGCRPSLSAPRRLPHLYWRLTSRPHRSPRLRDSVREAPKPRSRPAATRPSRSRRRCPSATVGGESASRLRPCPRREGKRFGTLAHRVFLGGVHRNAAWEVGETDAIARIVSVNEHDVVHASPSLSLTQFARQPPAYIGGEWHERWFAPVDGVDEHGRVGVGEFRIGRVSGACEAA